MTTFIVLYPMENLWSIVKRKMKDTGGNDGDEMGFLSVYAALHCGSNSFDKRPSNVLCSYTVRDFLNGDLMSYLNFPRNQILGFHYLKVIIIKITRERHLKYVPLSVVDLFNMRFVFFNLITELNWLQSVFYIHLIPVEIIVIRCLKNNHKMAMFICCDYTNSHEMDGASNGLQKGRNWLVKREIKQFNFPFLHVKKYPLIALFLLTAGRGNVVCKVP